MLCLFLNKTLSQCYFHSLEQCDGVLYTIVRHDMNVGFRPQKKWQHLTYNTKSTGERYGTGKQF